MLLSISTSLIARTRVCVTALHVVLGGSVGIALSVSVSVSVGPSFCVKGSADEVSVIWLTHWPFFPLSLVRQHSS